MNELENMFQSSLNHDDEINFINYKKGSCQNTDILFLKTKNGIRLVSRRIYESLNDEEKHDFIKALKKLNQHSNYNLSDDSIKDLIFVDSSKQFGLKRTKSRSKRTKSKR